MRAGTTRAVGLTESRRVRVMVRLSPTVALILVLAAPRTGAEDLEALFDLQGDPAYGEYLASECHTCHGGASDGIPVIDGWPKDAIVAALADFRAKNRDNAAMQLIAGRLSDEEIAALGAYFETLERQ